MPPINNSRREFLKRTTLTSLATGVAPSLVFTPSETESVYKGKQDHLVFLFQGDSITDGNRGRTDDPNHIMGHGYAFSIASRAGARFPDRDLTFYNRGVSGNTLADLTARWQNDILAIKPDVLSILIGINDTELALKEKDAKATRKYEDDYRTLLKEIKAQLPDCLLVLCEPFIAPVGRVKENWNEWKSEIEKKQEVVERLSNQYKTVFVPLQKVFD
jgi:lysophospholipase L1-like esterase